MTDTQQKTLPAPDKKPVGQAGFILSGTFVDDNKDYDMQMPQRLKVFDEMATDPSVKAPLERTSLPVFMALMLGTWVGGKTKKSQDLADFMNYTMHTMSGQTWAEFCANAVSDTKYGFSLCEILTTRATKGPYKGKIVPRKFAPRSQKSLYAWVWDDNFDQVIGYVQQPKTSRFGSIPDEFKSYIGDVSNLTLIQSQIRDYKFPIISTEESLHFKFGSINGNPEGESPLESCYCPWKEKTIISKYRMIGISRDYGGVPILRLPPELIEMANDPDHRYPQEELIYAEYKCQLANMHAGEQAYMIMSSQVNPDSNSMYEYDFKLLGVDGGGKQFDTSEIIKEKNTDIANAFLASHLLLGQQGNTSSYNASTAGALNNSLPIKKSILEKVNILKYHLATALFDANGIKYSHKDLPDFKYYDTDRPSLDDVGKFLQRVKSVGAATEGLVKFAYDLLDIDTEGLSLLDFTGEDKSKAGTSQGSSGQGSNGQQNSSTNMENKSMESSVVHNWSLEDMRGFKIDDHGDGSFALLDSKGDLLTMVDEN